MLPVFFMLYMIRRRMEKNRELTFVRLMPQKSFVSKDEPKKKKRGLDTRERVYLSKCREFEKTYELIKKEYR